MDLARTLIQMIGCAAIGVTIVFFFLMPIIKHYFSGVSASTYGEDEEQELCTACRYDVRGLTRCPECGVISPEGRRQQLAKLRDDWPTEQIAPRTPRPDEVPVVILTTDNSWAVDLLCQHLEARGILAKRNEVKLLHGAVYSNAKESYRLSVWSDDEERGRAILQRLWPDDFQK